MGEWIWGGGGKGHVGDVLVCRCGMWRGVPELPVSELPFSELPFSELLFS